MRDLSQYDGFRNLIKTADLIEFSSNGVIGQTIMAVTGRNVSHSSMVVRLPYQNSPRRYIVEAVRTGPEFRLISDVLQHYNGDVIWYGLKAEYDSKRDAIGEWLFDELAQHKGYDFQNVLMQLFGRVSLDAKRLYCTELCEIPYIKYGIIQPDPKGARRPGDLPTLGIFDSQAHLWGEQK
jgi:hypothetical protein